MESSDPTAHMWFSRGINASERFREPGAGGVGWNELKVGDRDEDGVSEDEDDLEPDEVEEDGSDAAEVGEISGNGSMQFTGAWCIRDLTDSPVSKPNNPTYPMLSPQITML